MQVYRYIGIRAIVFVLTFTKLFRVSFKRLANQTRTASLIAVSFRGHLCTKLVV